MIAADGQVEEKQDVEHEEGQPLEVELHHSTQLYRGPCENSKVELAALRVTWVLLPPAVARGLSIEEIRVYLAQDRVERKLP